jgi:hypothetical protein
MDTVQVSEGTTIPFLSEEGNIINFPGNLLQYTDLLEMLHRRRSGDNPIKTGVTERDLLLTEAICATGVLPCEQQETLRPQGFPSFSDLVGYMGITGIELNDKENKAINELLSYLGLPEFQAIKPKKKTHGGKAKHACIGPYTPDLREVAEEDEDGQIILSRWTKMPKDAYAYYDDYDDYWWD